VHSFFQRGLIVCWTFATICCSAGDSLTWRGDRVDADIPSADLQDLLQQIATATGWQVYLEPDTTLNISAKFKDLSTGDALHLLLGELSFALLPQTNSSPRLYVFRTAQRNATRLIHPVISRAASRGGKAIPNELIVRLKPGAKIEAIARLLGAKVIGRIDGLNTYRLEFANEAAARAARESLLDNPDVAAVDSNFSVDPPPTPQSLANGSGLDWNLKLKDNTGPCQIIVGLADTAVSPLGNGMDAFLLPSISVASPSPTAAAGLTHGTAMAQTILQSLQANSGGQTSVKILPINVYGANSTTTTFEVGQGIYLGAKAGANVFNLSLGGSGDSAFLHSLITSFSKQGVVFFGAAGNEPVTTPTYPAAYPEVIGVTASDPNGQIASYANRGSFVSIMEPGTSVVQYQGQYYLVSGTSTATAFATGTTAGLADSTRNCPDQVIPAIRSKLAVKTSASP
jgi:hypothetical protein